MIGEVVRLRDKAASKRAWEAWAGWMAELLYLADYDLSDDYDAWEAYKRGITPEQAAKEAAGSE